MCDVRAGLAYISVHLAHDPNVLVAVEQRVLVLPLYADTTGATMRSFVGLEARIGEDHDKPLGMFVG